MSEDLNARIGKSVAKVLRDYAVTGQIQFTFGKIVVDYFLFNQIGKEILDGKIQVIYSAKRKPREKYQGHYDNQLNEFVLHAWDTMSVKGRGLLIHEAVHAINDYNKLKGILKEDDEAAAYLAHGMYLIGKGIDPYQAKGPLQAGMTVAEVMMSESRITPEANELAYLHRAIRSSPLYSSEIGTAMSYNGI